MLEVEFRRSILLFSTIAPQLRFGATLRLYRDPDSETYQSTYFSNRMMPENIKFQYWHTADTA